MLNAGLRATRTSENAVYVDVIVEKIRAIRNGTVKKIDRRLCNMGKYEKLDLDSYLTKLLC